MKVYDTQEKEMIIEPAIKFAGNPNITVVAKAFGLRATVQVGLSHNIPTAVGFVCLVHLVVTKKCLQVVDVQVFATARVTFKPLLPVFPCFGKVIVSLMEKVRNSFFTVSHCNIACAVVGDCTN